MTQNIDTLYHLTPLQHGMLFHSLREPGSGVYVEHFSCRLQGPLDVARFRAAWQGVVQRHDSLKTLFLRLQEEKPVQVVRREVPLPFTELDWRDLPAAEQDRRFGQLLHDDRQRGFDPAVAPLMRLYLIALGQGGWRFLWSFHHAILDGWSTPVVLQEVFRLYGGGPALPPPQRRFRDHVAWLRGRDRGDSLSFWKARLKGWRRPLAFSPALLAPESAPAAGPRPVLRLRTALPAAWNDAAARCCREAQVTLNTLCQGAWALLLGLLADRDEVVHGLVFSGRSAELPGADRLVGLCLNTVPLRAALPAGQGLHEWLRALQADTVQTERHADCPLTEIASCAELPPGQPLFDAIYVFENYPGHAAFQALAGAHGLQASEACAQEQTHYGLALVVQPGEALHCELICDATRTPPASAEAVLHHYLHVLQCMVDSGDRRLDQLGLGAAPASFGPPAPQAAAAVSFLSRLQSHPGDAGCWADASQALSYSRLRRWLRQACRQWQLAGVGPGQRVLLVADDELQLLVLLLSGMACGVDCLVPGTDLPTLLGAGTRAWGEYGPQATAGFGPLPDGWPGHRFAPLADDDDAPVDPEPARGPPGACSRLCRGGQGDWQFLRYGEGQLLQAADSFLAACPVGTARAVALTGPLGAGAHLWLALAALAAGLEVRRLAQTGPWGPGNDLARPLVAPGARWHSVAFDAAQTRQLSRQPHLPALAADHWLLDAAGLTPGLQGRLAALPAGSRAVSQWHWPAASLPHARQVAGTGLAHPVPGGSLRVLDRHLHPAGTGARGCLAAGGPSVPATLRLNGTPWHAAHLALRDGTLLLAPVHGWMAADGCHADWPDALTGLDTPSPAWAHLPAELRAACPGLRDVALVERLDGRREWRCSVFYTLAGDADVGVGTGERLRAICEQLGLADAERIEVVPPLPSAAALVEGDWRPAVRSAATAPRTATEATLHGIWCRLLKQDRISVQDNFFDLGGQSLLASVMLFQVEEALGTALDLETLLAAPTIAGLAQAIELGGEAAGPAMPDLATEAVLPAEIRPPGPVRPSQPRTVFLTGATGFLGVHLLAELLRHTEARVICLVRAGDAHSGLQRLTAALQSHELWEPEAAARIVALPGELGEPRLGLTAERFAQLAEEIDLIYHNGAAVNFLLPYAKLKPVNVLATEDILRLACQGRAKPVHYVSTVGVLDRARPRLPEQLQVELHPRLLGGYEQSKWVAEQLLCSAAARGLPVSIYRPSRVVGHSLSGRMNQDDLFSRLLKGVVDFGIAPRQAGHDNMLPVDRVAAAIVEASLQGEGVWGRAVHVVNPRWHTLDAVLDQLERRGHRLERMDFNTWLAGLSARLKTAPEHPLAMVLPVLRKLNPMQDPSIGEPMAIDHAGLLELAPQALAGLGRMEDWLDRYLDHFAATGYLRYPTGRADAGPASVGPEAGAPEMMSVPARA